MNSEHKIWKHNQNTGEELIFKKLHMSLKEINGQTGVSLSSKTYVLKTKWLSISQFEDKITKY